METTRRGFFGWLFGVIAVLPFIGHAKKSESYRLWAGKPCVGKSRDMFSSFDGRVLQSETELNNFHFHGRDGSAPLYREDGGLPVHVYKKLKFYERDGITEIPPEAMKKFKRIVIDGMEVAL